VRRQIFGKVQHRATEPPALATGEDRTNGFMIGGSHRWSTARRLDERTRAGENTFSIKALWAAVARTARATKTTARWSAAPRTSDRQTKYAENQPPLCWLACAPTTASSLARRRGACWRRKAMRVASATD
jgi:hypothetical protein